jgi:hypothetical protein
MEKELEKLRKEIDLRRKAKGEWEWPFRAFDEGCSKCL